MTQLAEASAVSEMIRGILAELRRRFEALYGDRLAKLILYGSQARGDYRWWSDIDVMVVLEGPVDVITEMNRTEEISGDVSLKNDAVVLGMFAGQETLQHDSWPLFDSVRTEGVEF